jgi:L-ascorbate metabolism protein UlaG (beta-lactamase superfamily)
LEKEKMKLSQHASDGIISDLNFQGIQPGVSLWWLGQAGFCIRYGNLRIALDPYLSNSLAKKYASSKFPHKRMMPPPVKPEDLTMLDYVFCTHGHTDHMDGETLVAIAQSNPKCKFVVPASERHKAQQRGVPADRMIGVKAGDDLALLSDVSFTVVPAAHEERLQDADGNDYYLGYILKLGGHNIYHPGDCVPFEGQKEWLEPHAIELALMPVNGRDENRKINGVPGNFHLEEAVDLCRCTSISNMLGHHFGMFDFNTVDPTTSQEKLDQLLPGSGASLVQIGTRYVLSQ